MDAIRSKQLETAEVKYGQATGYGFARRYVDGKAVAVIGREDLGYGIQLMAEAAGSVTGLIEASRDLEETSKAHPAPNVSYRKVSLPDLPYPEETFDVVVAFQVIEKLEHPEDLVREAKRVLKRDGLLLISTPDRQTYSNDRNYAAPGHKSEMYTPEFRELLGRHFAWVRLYRQGTVAGGVIFEPSEKPSALPVECATFYSKNPSSSVESPATNFVMAVCGSPEAPEDETPRPYLILDRDRRVFDECREYLEDVELLRGEILHMQETEVQAFYENLEARNAEIRRLRGRERESANRRRELKGRARTLKEQVRNLEDQRRDLEDQRRDLEGQVRSLKGRMRNSEARVRDLTTRIRDIESSRAWRVLTLYRRLRGVNDLERPG